MEKKISYDELEREQLQSLLFNVPGMVYRGFPDWETEIVTRSKELSGYSVDEFNSKKVRWLDIIHPEDKDRVLKESITISSETSNISQEYRIITKCGKIKWVLDKKTARFSDKKIFQGVDGVVIDITTQKQAEENTIKFKAISDNANYGSAIADIDGILLYVNGCFAQMYGYEIHELIGQHISVCHNQNQDQLKDMHEALDILMQKGELNAKEMWHTRKDGSAFPILLNTSIIRDSHGKPQFLSATIVDITERIKTKKALQKAHDELEQHVNERTVELKNVNEQLKLEINVRKQREKELQFARKDWENIFQAFGHPTIIMDPQHRVIAANQAVVKATNLPVEELIQRKCYEVFHDAEEPDTSCPMERLLNSGHLETVEIEMKTLGGTYLVACTPVLNEKGELEKIIHIATDISRRKHLEGLLRQTQKMEAIGRLAGGIAHDFNNILTGIQGSVTLVLLSTDPANSNYEKLKNIERYVKDGANLTQQLLGFAKGGKYEVKTEDINKIIEQSAKMFGSAKKEIGVHTKLYGGELAAEVDQSQFNQVLLNLYINAWQAMPDGGDLYIETDTAMLDEEFVEPFQIKPVQVKPVQIKPAQIQPAQIQPGKFVKINISDNGPGMDSETCKKIFDPFFTTKKVGRGVGLGLASVYSIIENHGGIIRVWSKQGKGTKFTIYLPMSEKQPFASEESHEKIIKGKETILLVDDEDMIIEVGGQILSSLGYTVLTAKGGKEAIATFKAHQQEIDLVLLDMIMPDLSGKDVYDILVEIDAEIKVLLSSGYSKNDRIVKLLEKGCNGFIQKPFDLITLSKKIRTILDDES